MNTAKDQARRLRYRKKHPDRIRESDRKYRASSKQKISARSAVNYQIRAGYWVKPNNCSHCFQVKAVEAHHHDYTKKLDVLWLCKDCHEQVK